MGLAGADGAGDGDDGGAAGCDEVADGAGGLVEGDLARLGAGRGHGEGYGGKVLTERKASRQEASRHRVMW